MDVQEVTKEQGGDVDVAQVDAGTPVVTASDPVFKCPTCGWWANRSALKGVDVFQAGIVVESTGWFCIPCAIRKARELGLLVEMTEQVPEVPQVSAAPVAETPEG